MKYWSYHEGLKKWIEIGASGRPIYTEDARTVGIWTTLPCHTTGDEAPSEIPRRPADLTEINVEVQMVVSMKFTKSYGPNFSPDQLYFSVEHIEENYHTAQRTEARVVEVTGFDKKYKCTYCEERGTDEEPHKFQLCRCGAIGCFFPWVPKRIWKEGEVIETKE